MNERQRFPFPPLPVGEMTPHAGPGDLQALVRRDVAIVRWFIEHRWGRRLKPSSTLAELLAASEKADLKGQVPPIETLESENARHGLHLSAALERLAWAIRALHGHEGTLKLVHSSFIDDELMGEDTKQQGAERRLPGGIGTMVFAGRLIQAGAGRILSINGHGARGHDIRWVTGHGDTVLVERKDRSYEAGLCDTPDKRVKRVIAEVKAASANMPNEELATRVLIVGFQHLVRASEAPAVDRAYESALKDAFQSGSAAADNLPHFVVVEHLGLEPKGGGERWDFFSPQVLQEDERRIDRIGPLLLKAVGARVTLNLPGG
jgi:hypothetical protein